MRVKSSIERGAEYLYTKLGDVVTVSGTVRTNKDFGAGYTYKVLIEEASLQP